MCIRDRYSTLVFSIITFYKILGMLYFFCIVFVGLGLIVVYIIIGFTTVFLSYYFFLCSCLLSCPSSYLPSGLPSCSSSSLHSCPSSSLHSSGFLVFLLHSWVNQGTWCYLDWGLVWSIQFIHWYRLYSSLQVSGYRFLPDH